MTVPDYTKSFASLAEHELGALADLATDPAVISDPQARVICTGLAAVTNALLSLDEAVRSGTIDVSNAVLIVDDHVCDSINAHADRLAQAVTGVPGRRSWWWRR